jgi:hypothetical protein
MTAIFNSSGTNGDCYDKCKLPKSSFNTAGCTDEQMEMNLVDDIMYQLCPLGHLPVWWSVCRSVRLSVLWSRSLSVCLSG